MRIGWFDPCSLILSNYARRGDVSVLPFEIQQRLQASTLLQLQRFHLPNNNQVIPGGVFSVYFAIKPVKAAGQYRATQGRCLPLDVAPLVRASLGELPGNRHLLVGQNIDSETSCLTNFWIAGRTSHHVERHQRRVHRHAMERLAGKANGLAFEVRCDHRDAGSVVPERFAKTQRLNRSSGK